MEPSIPARRSRGRPRLAHPGVSHLRREHFGTWRALHVTLRVRPDVRNLRGCALFRAIHAALRSGNQKPGFRLVEYSVQRTHLHLLIESSHSGALSRGMQGLSIRLARTINRRMRRKGKVFRDRFHSRVLRTPREALAARRYVLNNARRHTRRHPRNRTAWRDPCSSAPYCPDWVLPPDTPCRPLDQHARALHGLGHAGVPPVTDLLRRRWRSAGSLVLTDIPGPPDG